MINLFCDSILKPKDIYSVEKDIKWIIARSVWDAHRYIIGAEIHNLSLPLEFAPDLDGDIFLGEALLHTIINTQRYPSGRISIHSKGVIDNNVLELIRVIDTARGKTKVASAGDTKDT